MARALSAGFAVGIGFHQDQCHPEILFLPLADLKDESTLADLHASLFISDHYTKSP